MGIGSGMVRFAGAPRAVPCGALPRPVPPRTRAGLTGVESGPSPPFASAASLLGSPSAGAAGALVTADTVAFAEPPEIERADPQAQGFEVRPHVAGAVCLATMPEHVNQGRACLLQSGGGGGS